MILFVHMRLLPSAHQDAMDVDLLSGEGIELREVPVRELASGLRERSI